MITKLEICDHHGTDPYHNLALEQYMTEHVAPGECILYLWQNARTVVIGRNQNAWKECDTEALRADGGKLARRLSGGGAVFHDMGNLNFTFIMPTEDFDVERQLSVIIRACERFGIKAQMTGRNDLTVCGCSTCAGMEDKSLRGLTERNVGSEGAKFSGNAFYHHHGKSYHHGTILVDADMALMSRYLRPHPEKLRAKGVDSVRSRVVNLCDICPGLTVEAMRGAMKAAFLDVYSGARVMCEDGQKLHELVSRQSPASAGTGSDGSESHEALSVSKFERPEEYPVPDERELSALLEHYKSDEWNLGEHREYDASFAEKFEWGLVEICLKVRENRVVRADIYTDSMETEWTGAYKEAFEGAEFSREGLREAAARAVGQASREAARNTKGTGAETGEERRDAVSVAADMTGMTRRFCDELFTEEVLS